MITTATPLDDHERMQGGAGCWNDKVPAEAWGAAPRELIGESSGMKQVLRQVATVATTDSTVMILGETGTGKELIARAIHSLSSRRERALVRADCAALPAGLLESELFGHEKGAFTGAITRNVGRFELAHAGTLFLDEVGDIPLELQSKLLRVLQEQELERLGSTRTIRVNFRLVAATNRNLSQLVEEGRFRSDLYYRVNVFPIEVPPLRERKEDIPLLVGHFVKKCARRLDKRIDSIRPEDMETLRQYPWPGNVRELQNVIERCVILSSNGVLHRPQIPEQINVGSRAALGGQTLADAERKYISQVLRDKNGLPAIGFSDEAILMLQNYFYPGVMPEHFPARADSKGERDSRQLEIDLLSLPFHKSISELEKRLIGKAIKESGGNKSEAANRLQINRRLLYNKMEEHKIDA